MIDATTNTPMNTQPFSQAQVPAGRNRNMATNRGDSTKNKNRRRMSKFSGVC